MSKAIVEDLGDGNWLIKPTGEIRKCSRSTAYRIAKKAEQAIQEMEAEHDTVMDMQDETELQQIEIKEYPTEQDETEIPILDLPEGLEEESELGSFLFDDCALTFVSRVFLAWYPRILL